MKGFVFRLIPPRSDFAFTMNDEERATMTMHFGYWSGLAAEGKVLAFGPVDDPNGGYGIGIVLAEDAAEATALRDGDPAVLSPHGFRAEIAPMLSLVTPTGRFDG
jgi:uncharacterized protein YciI